MGTPFTWLARRIRFGRRSLRWAAAAALVASILIVVTGGVVRVTGSGLGCPTWPACTTSTLGPTAEMGIHGLVEFGNRVLTVVLCIVVGWLIVVSRLQAVPVPRVTRWAWVQFWIIVLNAVVGGVTVLARLSPYVVAAHFLAATLLLTAATVAWRLVGSFEDRTTPQTVPASVRRLSTALVAITAILVVAGTAVTGAGPHAGDSASVERIPIDWGVITIAHAITASAVLVLTISVWLVTRRSETFIVHRRAGVLVLVLVAQGIVGLVQSITGLPEMAVVLHLLGSALVWAGVVSLLLDAHERPHVANAPLGTELPASPE